MLAPVPVAMALGLGGGTGRFDALQVLNANGDVIGISTALAERMRAAGYGFDFRDAVLAGAALAAAAQGVLRIGVPFVFSMHAELVHYWLDSVAALAGRIEIVTVPPPLMAAALQAGEIDAFCVGEPWGSVAVDSGAGALLLPGTAIWAFAPEKVLAVRQGWPEAEPQLTGRLMRAVWRAGRWLGDRGNHMMAAEILARPGRIDVPAELIERALSGRLAIDGAGTERVTSHLIEFFAGAATFPWRSQAAWIGTRLAQRYGLPERASADLARSVFRSDLYRQHLRVAGADLPGASEKIEGSLDHASPVASERGRMILAADQFFDRRVFDPAPTPR